jgi:hypothetical protein
VTAVCDHAKTGRDALTRDTRPVSGAYYFIPSIEALRRRTEAA